MKKQNKPKVPEAYSLECEDIIDAEEAYERYWAGKITDKRKFICVFPECEAQITCANIDKERNSMRRRPHFKVVGEHHKNCDFKADENDDINIISIEEKAVEQRFIDSSIDVILTGQERIEKKKNKTVVHHRTDHVIKKRELKEKRKSEGRRYSEYSTLDPVVAKYHGYRENELLDVRRVNNEGRSITYNQLFVSINNYSTDYLDDYKRVYFGKATVKSVQGHTDDYILEFLDKINFRDLQRHPSVYISKKSIDISYTNHIWKETLDSYSDTDVKLNIYVYGKINLVRKVYSNLTENSDDRIYYGLNIKLCDLNLDYLAFRHEDENNFV